MLLNERAKESMNTARSVVCVTCDAPFQYAYKGGRNRATCSPVCTRKRNTKNQARARSTKRQRPDGYVPADCPIHVQTVPVDVQTEFREYAEYTRYTHHLKAQPDGVTEGFTRRSAGNDPDAEDPQNSIRTLLNAQHGFVLDDVQVPDKYPLRNYQQQHRGIVKQWHTASGFPLAGFRGVPGPKRGEPYMFVLGSIGDPSSLPPRITRRFCSENALTPLEPFVTFSL